MTEEHESGTDEEVRPDVFAELPLLDSTKQPPQARDVRAQLARTLRATEPLPPVGVAMWDERMRHVGEVVSVEGSRVRLRPLNGGRAWQSAPSDLRYARVIEIRSMLLARFNEGKGDAR
ncbi:hypothetical protein AB0H18_19520 [Streptomyces sp. NPDC020766]|uniref:hypothetical protein n=1 Tax=Streptomyces sp. NPDC020766 TaxID=3155011 RepID=UPI0034084E96